MLAIGLFTEAPVYLAREVGLSVGDIGKLE